MTIMDFINDQAAVEQVLHEGSYREDGPLDCFDPDHYEVAVYNDQGYVFTTTRSAMLTNSALSGFLNHQVQSITSVITTDDYFAHYYGFRIYI